MLNFLGFFVCLLSILNPLTENRGSAIVWCAVNNKIKHVYV